MKVRILENEVNLTPTEVNLMKYIVHGHTDQQMAAARNVSVGTVRLQVKALLYKTTLANKVSLAVWGVLFGGFAEEVDLSQLVTER